MPKSRLAAGRLAEIAVREAEKSKRNGTFGVGGLLVDDRGAIVKVIGNSVIKNGPVHDPTAHVERQLVDWYYSSKNLPAPGRMTIITSLDPCLMCCGAILSGGFNVIYVSQDSEAGVSCRGPGDLSTLPAESRKKAEKTFSAFGVAGKRPFSGPRSSIFYGSEIDGRLDSRSIKAFSSSLKKVKGIVSGHHGRPPDELANPKFAKSSRLLRLLKKYNPKVFSKGHVVSFDRPEIDLGRILIQKARESAGAFDSACLVDPFGNVLLAQGSDGQSPIRTPFMELVRRYHKLLIEAGHEGRRHLAHMKYCKTVLLYGPGRDPESLMNLGCFGSAIEGKLPKGKQLEYVIPRQSQDELQAMLDNLPPLFSRVVRIKDAIRQAKDPELYEFCKDNAPKKKKGSRS